MVLKSNNLEIMQALLICDNFNNEFQPIQSDQPLALLKIVNYPIIEYCLTFFKSNGIEQVILFTSNVTKVKYYLQERKWIKDSDEIQFAIVQSSDNLTSLGDVMRDVFNNNLIKSDFILLNGNIIAGNLTLLDYLKVHINRRKNEDKGLIMTIIYNQLIHNHRSRSKDNEPILVIDKDTKKILYYETYNSNNSLSKINLKLDLFQRYSNFKIHFDLQDTNIAICSIAVPQLFADNFDYNTKDDFVRGILVHEDILENTIYSEIIEATSYAIKVNDAFSYDSVSRDLIERWSFPIVPDLQEDLCYSRHNIYKSSTVDLKIDSILERNLVIGKETKIDSGTRISDSVIGENCRLGKNVRIDGCYLMDNVQIGDDCKLIKCILSNSVQIKRNCELRSGCILGRNCVIGPDITLDQCTLLQEKSEFDDAMIDYKLVGKEGKCYLFKYDDDEEEEDDEEDNDLNVKRKHKLLWGQEIKKSNELEEIDNSTEDSEFLSCDSDEADEQSDDDEEDDEFKHFYKEVLDSLHRGLVEKIECKNLILEINCSKHAYNIPIEAVVCLVIKAILELPQLIDKDINNERAYFVKFQSVLQYCLLIFQNYVKTEESQLDCLMTLENYALIGSPLFNANSLVRTIKHLYDKDILKDDELILKWFKVSQPFPATLNQVANEERTNLRSNNTLSTFIQWLMEAEEESSDDE